MSNQSLNYPWSELVSTFDQGDDSDVIDDPIAQREELQKTTSRLEQTKTNLAQLTEVSNTSFDELRTKLDNMTAENKELQSQCETLNAELKRQSLATDTARSELHVLKQEVQSNHNSEIRNIVLQEFVIAHSKKCRDAKLRKRVMTGVFASLRQRAKIVKYLNMNNLHEQYRSDLESMLLLTKSELENIIDEMVVPSSSQSS